MASGIGRRQFISALSGAAVMWPVAPRAQRPALPVIGWLGARSPGESEYVVAAFHKGLNETGYAEGRNVAIEYRWAELQYDRLPGFANELVGRQVAVIAATGGGASALAAKAATATIPIVFVAGDIDPVKSGLVASLNRPGDNITGVSLLLSAAGAKRLQLLRDLLPTATAIGLLVNPTKPSSEFDLRDFQEAARTLGIELSVIRASTDRDLETAVATLVQHRVDALLVGNDSFFLSRRDRLVAMAGRVAVPTMYFVREFAAAGGLMSYGTSNTDAYRLVGTYTGRILKGEKPTELPVQQAVKFDLVINLKTAQALGLTIPPGVLAIADEVIE
jgi:putative tryptophan/tyrosine transport system substrate-binding protein